jgi:hypothetical protein
MLGKLKGMVANSPVEKVSNVISIHLQDKLTEITKFNVTDLQDDDKYSTIICKPTLTAINASSGGLTKLIPGFKRKFEKMMIHLRNELIDLTGETPKLKDDFKKNLQSVLLAGLKK